MNDGSLTPKALLASVSESLEKSEYVRVEAEQLGEAGAIGGRCFEDNYRVVMVVVFDTWAQLSERWTDAQAALDELMSAHLTKQLDKSWDGYLVLLTPDPCPPSGNDQLERIRYDTFRVRKLVAAGDELTSLGDVERVLSPLLPMRSQGVAPHTSALDLLPSLLAEQGIDREAVEALLAAFSSREPLIDALHSVGGEG